MRQNGHLVGLRTFTPRPPQHQQAALALARQIEAGRRDPLPIAVDMFEGKCPRRLEVRRGHRLGLENGGTQTDRIVWGMRNDDPVSEGRPVQLALLPALQLPCQTAVRATLLAIGDTIGG